MALDYTNPERTVNFRDVGEFVNLIAGEHILHVKRIYRSGTIKYIKSPDVIKNPKTIFNLQKSEDRNFNNCIIYHFPISNDHEKYDTSDKEVRTWLRSIMATLTQDIGFPLYIYCLSGKDRTGVVIAAILFILGISEQIIIEEYLLSEGDVPASNIKMALDGLKDIDRYFDGIDLQKIRNKILLNNKNIGYIPGDT